MKIEISKREEEQIIYERTLGNEKEKIKMLMPLMIGVFLGILLLVIYIISQTDKGEDIIESLALIFITGGIVSTFTMLIPRISKADKAVREFRDTNKEG
jgi:hypothetical protein